MLIRLKNKDTLKIDQFSFKCCIGKKGLKAKKAKAGPTQKQMRQINQRVFDAGTGGLGPMKE